MVVTKLLVLTTLAATLFFVTKQTKRLGSFLSSAGSNLAVLGLVGLTATPIGAAILPEEKVDLFMSVYDGGGAEIDGPSVLVRKNFADKVSVWGHYFVDIQSNASIDVVTQGSPDGLIEEDRVETSIGAEYLIDRTTMSFSTTNSDEDDYKAKSYSLGVSQDFFGDMTTLSLGYSYGDDRVGRNIYVNGEKEGTEFVGEATHRSYSIGLTQVITKSWMLSLNGETVIDEGFLRNAYRSVRFRTSTGVGREEERYPSTRNSDALAIRSMYYLPYRASLRAEYRWYTDSWGIDGNHYELKYTHPYGENWIFELRWRQYTQEGADFYSELLPSRGSQDFYASDKEMSTFNDDTIGIGVSYLINAGFSIFNKASVNFRWDRIRFEYEDFLDKTRTDFAPGEEPAYSFDADMIRLFFSLYY